MMHGGPAAADRIRDLAGERAQHEPDAPPITTAQHMRTINCDSSAHAHNQLQQLSTWAQSTATAQHMHTINCDSSAPAHNQLRQLSTCAQSTATAQHMHTINCDSSAHAHNQLRQLNTWAQPVATAQHKISWAQPIVAAQHMGVRVRHSAPHYCCDPYGKTQSERARDGNSIDNSVYASRIVHLDNASSV